MRSFLLRLYLRFRDPDVFVVVVCTFITTSILLHFFRGYDSDWGGTNLTLSIEASIASAVLTKMAKKAGQLQEKIAESQARMLESLLTVAEAQRNMLSDHTAILRALKEADERLLKALTEKEE
jgi:hypothetical protein